MLKYEEKKKTAFLTFETNESNSLDLSICDEFEKVLPPLKKNKKINTVVVTGKGPFFSNGFDPNGFINQSDEKIIELLRRVFMISYELYTMPQYTIAALNGHTMGAGAIWAVHVNYRISVEKIRIGFPEVLIGLAVPAAPAFLLQQLVGARKTRDLAFHGSGLKSDAALEIGLVDEVVESERLMDIALKRAQKFENIPFDVMAANQLTLKQNYLEDLKDLTEQDIEMGIRLIKSENGQEGLKSILERRRPKFT